MLQSFLHTSLSAHGRCQSAVVSGVTLVQLFGSPFVFWGVYIWLWLLPLTDKSLIQPSPQPSCFTPKKLFLSECWQVQSEWKPKGNSNQDLPWVTSEAFSDLSFWPFNVLMVVVKAITCCQISSNSGKLGFLLCCLWITTTVTIHGKRLRDNMSSDKVMKCPLCSSSSVWILQSNMIQPGLSLENPFRNVTGF